MFQLNRYFAIRLPVLIAVVTLTGCASREQRMFPEIYAASRPVELDVLIDVTVTNDLEGDELGIDRARNEETARIFGASLDAILTNAGYAVRTLRSGHGLAWDRGSASVYLANGMQSTGIPYAGPGAANNDDPWLAGDARTFLRTLVVTARMRRDDPETPEAQTALAALKALARPAALQQVRGRYLLMAYMTVHDAADAKEYAALAGGLMVGVGMAAVGPIALFPLVPTSFSNVELVLFDTQSGEIAWSSRCYSRDDGLKDQQYALRTAIAKFPSHPGRQAHLPEALRRKL